MDKITEDIQFLKDAIRMLVGMPQDSLTRVKQKTCAHLVQSYIKQTKAKGPELEYMKFLDDICQEHESSNLGGHLLVSNIRLDEYTEDIRNYISYCIEQEIDEQELTSFIDIIQIKINSNEILSSINTLITESIKLKSETSYSRMLTQYEKLVQQQYLKITEIKLSEDPTNEVTIEPTQLNNTLLTVERLSNISKHRVKVKTGFSKFDNLLKGGFEPTRIYIFGGKPGIGKSSLLLNFLYFSMTKNKFKEESKPNILVYISLENDMVETTERLFSIMLQENINFQTLKPEQSKQLEQAIQSCPTSLKCKYMKPYTTTTMDIFVFLDKIAQNYKIRAVFIDYLNLIRASSSVFSEKRHELGAVTSELKVIAKQLQCPVIVPTQLNTAGYDGVPTMKNLDESRQIAQNADFVGLIFELPEVVIPPEILYQYPSTQYAYVAINIDKNRNGPTDIYPLLLRKETFTFVEVDKTSQILTNLRNWMRNKSKYDNQDSETYNVSNITPTVEENTSNLFLNTQLNNPNDFV